MWFGVVEALIALTFLLMAYYKWCHQYWKRRGVPFLEPSIPFGNSESPVFRKEHSSIRVRRQYDEMRANGWKHGGSYSMLKPRYIPLDLEYVKNIMTRDFQYFTDRGLYYNEKDDPLSAHLFVIEGEKWRNLRVKLTPTFTSGKMKMMFHTLLKCEPNLIEQIESDRLNQQPSDIKEVLRCLTTDVIGSCVFGLECNAFKDENSPFRVYGKRAFIPTPAELIKLLFVLSFPKLAAHLKLKTNSDDVINFFMKVIKDTVSYREKTNYTRNDFIQLLIELKNNKLAEVDGYKHDGKTLTIEQIAALSFGFWTAGFETSSATMSFALYELARTPDIQQKVRDEVNEVLAKHDGKITYDAIQEMKYMDQVINETLRLYPPLPLIPRMCVKDYKIPDQDVVIEKGTPVLIPVYAIHRDKEYYPEPDKFDPDRFSPENKAKRHHYAHIPFGEGPRLCIGMRFGLMQSKVGLASLLRNYKFTVNKKTQEPLKMKTNSFTLDAEGAIWMDAQKI